jgi:alpha 1,2-mannosyltransferase
MVKNKTNAVFCYLVRSDINTFKQLFKSLSLLTFNFNKKYQYPIIIFHESNFSFFFRLLLKTFYNNLKFNQIIFDKGQNIEGLKFKDNFPNMGWGYRNMCNFFHSDIFSYLKEYDYYCRLDTDSYLISELHYDIFTTMVENNFEYGYIGEVLENPEAVVGLGDFVKEYINKNTITPFQFEKVMANDSTYNLRTIYTNFEIVKLSIFFREDIIKFQKSIIDTHKIYEYRWGDAPLRTFMLAIFLQPTRIVRFADVNYRHLPFEQNNGSIISPFTPLEWIESCDWIGKEYVCKSGYPQ